MKWEKIEDTKVHCIWVPIHECKEECDAQEVCVTPDWYEQNGTPVCCECGTDLEYSHTEIAVPTASISAT